jgi:hypothetical protein
LEDWTAYAEELEQERGDTKGNQIKGSEIIARYSAPHTKQNDGARPIPGLWNRPKVREKKCDQRLQTNTTMKDADQRDPSNVV